MSLENMTSFYLCYFTIISTHPTRTKTANNPAAKLVGVTFKLTKRMSFTVFTELTEFTVVCLRSPQNLEFGHFGCCFAVDGKEMYQNLKRTYGRFVLLTKPIEALSLPSSLLKFANITQTLMYN